MQLPLKQMPRSRMHTISCMLHKSSQTQFKCIMSTENTPQLDLMMDETAKLSIAYTIDDFLKAEKCISRPFQNRPFWIKKGEVLSFGATK